MGFAAVFPNTTSGGRLTGEASIFTAELYAINAAVHEILKGTIDGNRFTIFSDSRSALLALRSDSPILGETRGVGKNLVRGGTFVEDELGERSEPLQLGPLWAPPGKILAFLPFSRQFHAHEMYIFDISKNQY